MSRDGSTALVVIALLGNPFSPSYARARKQARPFAPLDFSAFNVSLTREGASRWALTERPAAAVSRDAATLAIGRSSMRWAGDRLVIAIDERTAPWGRPLRGQVVFRPRGCSDVEVPIDGRGLHLWWPIAPLGDVEVTLDEPRMRFDGTGYFDGNAGGEPLEEAFARWSWARISSDGAVAITYDVETLRCGALDHAYTIDASGVRPLETPRLRALGRTRFGLERSVRCPSDADVRVLRSLEDGPFYARSMVESLAPDGRLRRGVHEVVSLERFASPWVRFLLPFRMRREAA